MLLAWFFTTLFWLSDYLFPSLKQFLLKNTYHVESCEKVLYKNCTLLEKYFNGKGKYYLRFSIPKMCFFQNHLQVKWLLIY